jgi:hypothetical protein
MSRNRSRRSLRARVGVVVALALCAVGPAGAIDDPTRPPAGLRSEGGKRTDGDGSLVLESVMISGSSRSAIISGKHVMLGGQIGPGRLVKVSEGAVVLLIGSGQRRLELYPGVHKRTERRGVEE